MTLTLGIILVSCFFLYLAFEQRENKKWDKVIEQNQQDSFRDWKIWLTEASHHSDKHEITLYCSSCMKTFIAIPQEVLAQDSNTHWGCINCLERIPVDGVIASKILKEIN